MKTFQPKQKDIKREWHLVDLKDKVLGRSASEIAKVLMGKHKVSFANHMDMGDYVVVVNAQKVVLTGRKKEQKVYRKHSNYPGGFKEIKVSKWLEENPKNVIKNAVSGMIPKNRLHQDRMRRLKVFSGSEHKYGDKFKKAKSV